MADMNVNEVLEDFLETVKVETPTLFLDKRDHTIIKLAISHTFQCLNEGDGEN